MSVALLVSLSCAAAFLACMLLLAACLWYRHRARARARNTSNKVCGPDSCPTVTRSKPGQLDWVCCCTLPLHSMLLGAHASCWGVSLCATGYVCL